MNKDVKLTKLAECAGCGAKVGAGELAQLFEGFAQPRDPNLLVGFDRADDAAVYRVSDDVAMVQTLDFFPPIADDPYVFGAIAAANALSDIYAMGACPKTALNIMMVPEDMDAGIVREILRGGASKVAEAGAVVCGGHSIYDREPKYGMAVTGLVHPDRVLANAGACVGDALLYTKPLGIGILSTAAKAQALQASAEAELYQTMMTLNRAAHDLMDGYRVHACTDITGFGVVGHALEMAQASDVALELRADAFDVFDGALDFARMGFVPAGAYRNRRYAGPHVGFDGVSREMADVLFDPQTSGGLFVAVASEDAAELLTKLAPVVSSARLVGQVVAHQEDAPFVRVRS